MDSPIQRSAPNSQNAAGSMTYPAPGTLNRLLFKTPLVWWRSGLGGLIGRYMLVLTTWGRKSHRSRHTMLSYTHMDERIYIGAGWGLRCDWYQNLAADPHATLQIWSRRVSGTDKELVLPALARRVTDEDEFRRIAQRLFETGGDSLFRPWLESYGIAYDCEAMVANRERIYQLALDLQPAIPANQLAEAGYPYPMETDLKWIWAVVAGSFGLGLWVGSRRR